VIPRVGPLTLNIRPGFETQSLRPDGPALSCASAPYCPDGGREHRRRIVDHAGPVQDGFALVQSAKSSCRTRPARPTAKASGNGAEYRGRARPGSPAQWHDGTALDGRSACDREQPLRPDSASLRRNARVAFARGPAPTNVPGRGPARHRMSYPNDSTESRADPLPRPLLTASPARLGWRSPRGSPRSVRCRGALPGEPPGPSTSPSDQHRTMSHHRRSGALTAGSTLTVGDWKARLRAGVSGH